MIFSEQMSDAFSGIKICSSGPMDVGGGFNLKLRVGV